MVPIPVYIRGILNTIDAKNNNHQLEAIVWAGEGFTMPMPMGCGRVDRRIAFLGRNTSLSTAVAMRWCNQSLAAESGVIFVVDLRNLF